MDKDVWKKAIGEDAHQKVVRSCDRYEGGICTEEGKGVSIVKGGERESKGVCEGTVEEEIHSAV